MLNISIAEIPLKKEFIMKATATHSKQIISNAALSVPVNSPSNVQEIPRDVENRIKEFINIIVNAPENVGRLAAVFSSLVDNVLEGKLNSSNFISLVMNPSPESSATKSPLVLAHCTALDIASTIWLWGCQVDNNISVTRFYTALIHHEHQRSI